jgi:hypothetical protein
MAKRAISSSKKKVQPAHPGGGGSISLRTSGLEPIIHTMVFDRDRISEFKRTTANQNGMHRDRRQTLSGKSLWNLLTELDELP